MHRGSIDVNFLPDLSTIAGVAVPVIEQAAHTVEFGKNLKDIIEFFLPKKRSEQDASPQEKPAKDDTKQSVISARDCDDVMGILGPIANHGGTQSITVINAPGGVVMNVSDATAPDARRGIESAARIKARLTYPQAETRQAVSMVWKRVGTDKARIDGKHSPDKAIIEEIDTKPKSVFFTDEMSHIKKEMIADEKNPYQMVYFVDVEISRVRGRVVSYRVIGFHGKESLSDIYGLDLDLDDIDISDL